MRPCVLLIIGFFFWVDVFAQSVCDSNAVVQSGTHVKIELNCWNEIAEEYNRLKEESIASKKMLDFQAKEIEILRAGKAKQDSLAVVSNGLINALKSDNKELFQENKQLKLDKKSKITYLGIGYISGVLTVFGIKLLL